MVPKPGAGVAEIDNRKKPQIDIEGGDYKTKMTVFVRSYNTNEN